MALATLICSVISAAIAVIGMLSSIINSVIKETIYVSPSTK